MISVQQRRGAVSNLSRRVLAATLGASICMAGCDPADEQESAEEPPFGLGGKADLICSPDADLCWDTDDSDAMRFLLLAQDDVMLGIAPKSSLAHVLDLARGFEHKLSDAESTALDELAANVAALPDDTAVEDAVALLTQVQERVLKRVIGAYYMAHMVPVGQAVDNGGKFDETDDTAPTDAESVTGLSEGMEESLRLLRDSGVLGIAVASMYKLTGVLGRDYELVNAINFGEFDAVTGRIIPRGLSREAKVDQIIVKYRRAAGFVGAGAGVVGLVPIAGIPLSISGETVGLFKLHAQMAFEIAAVYGWDIREGNSLYLMSTMFMTDGLLTEVGDVLVSNLLVPLLAKKIAAKLGVELSKDLATQVASRSISSLLGFFTKKAQEKLAQEAIKGASKGIASQLLGWATLGMTVFVSAAIDWVVTDRMGRHVETVSKAWLHDLLMEGTTYLSMPQARDCTFQSLAAVSWADGTVNEREQKLYMAFLAKPYAVDEQTWFFLDSNERVRQSETLRDFPTEGSIGAIETCLSAHFQDSLSQHRMSLLGHLYGMMHVDTEENADELQLYQRLREGLDGSGFFDGDAIDDPQMDFIQRAIFVTVNPNVIEASPELEQTTSALLVEDVLTFLAEPHPDTKRDFDCGFAGQC